MSGLPRPIEQVAAIPVVRPFIGPEELARDYHHSALLRLGANESNFGPPPRAVEAMKAAIARTSWYGDPESYDLRVELAKRHRCSIDNILVTAGSDDLIGLVVRAYLGAGRVTVATLGTYPTFGYHVTGYGSTIAGARYAADGTIQLEALARAAHQHRTPLVYLANPDNPSGSFVPRELLAEFVVALPSETLVLLDEAYSDFVEPSELLIEEIDPRIIRARTFSKAYGFAGARIGYGLASTDVIETLCKVRLQYGVNRTAQIGALAALGEVEFVADVVRENERGRLEYADLGRRLGGATLPSRTNFLCFDLGSRKRADATLRALLARGVFVRKPLQPPLDRCIRVTVGTADERARFAEVFESVLTAERQEATA